MVFLNILYSAAGWFYSLVNSMGIIYIYLPTKWEHQMIYMGLNHQKWESSMSGSGWTNMDLTSQRRQWWSLSVRATIPKCLKVQVCEKQLFFQEARDMDDLGNHTTNRACFDQSSWRKKTSKREVVGINLGPCFNIQI